MDDYEKFIKGQKVITCILTIVNSNMFSSSQQNPSSHWLVLKPLLEFIPWYFINSTIPIYSILLELVREALWKYLVFCPITKLNDPLSYWAWTFWLEVQHTDRLRPPNLPVCDLNYIQLSFIFSFSSGVFGSLQTWWTGHCTF